MLPLLVLLGTIAGAWYLLIVRPQKHQQTRHGRIVDQLQVGSHVLTVGGIYGRVASIEGDSVVLEFAPGLQSRITTDGVARIVAPSEAPLPAPAEAHQIDERDTRDATMHHDQHQHQPASQQRPVPAWAPPQQPYVLQQPATAPHPVAPSVIPTFELRPWSDVVPRNLPATPSTPSTPSVQQHQPVAPPLPAASPSARRHSRAPQGMGSSLRRDDPSLQDVMSRARDERSVLANEYRKLTAPLVALDEPATPQAAPQTAVPRPVVTPPPGGVDPALTPSAFQRSTPYSPDPALRPQQAPTPA